MIYNNIKQGIIDCKNCPLSEQLDYGCMPVWGAGSKLADILILNLRASQEAHLIEKPIETKYSLLLHKILEKSGLEDKNVFVTNLLKCKCDTTPAKPFKANLETCKRSWLYKEIECIPSIKSILVMGKNTLQRFLDNKMDIDEVNEITYSVNGLRVFATYSLEEIFRKGSVYMDHSVKILKNIRDINAKIETSR